MNPKDQLNAVIERCEKFAAKRRPAAWDVKVRVIRDMSRDSEDVNYKMEYTIHGETAAAAGIKKPAMRTVEVGRTLDRDEDPWKYAAHDFEYIKKQLEQNGIAVEKKGKDTLHFAISPQDISAKNIKNASPENPESGKNEKRRSYYI